MSLTPCVFAPDSLLPESSGPSRLTHMSGYTQEAL